MIHVHRLGGCAPAPLAHYLKALGVLRLVAEQADADVRGWWREDRYLLATKLSRDKLERFFLDDYQPTPMFNPWGARSGYYDNGSEKSAREFLKKIEDSTTTRLKPFRTAIKIVRSVIDDTTDNKKPTDKQKDKLIFALRREARGASLRWLDTVTALIGAGDSLQLAQPPIFGTGGSEGSGGYPSGYMSAVVEAVLDAKWNHAIQAVLFGGSAPQSRWDQTLGQFAPGSASTPWDMLLAFEGACVLRSAVSGRTTSHSQRWMSSPFYVAPRSAGYASGSRLDEKFLNKGKEYPGRGEQWLPMWERPSNCREIQEIFLQGRATAKATHVTDGWSMARAVSGFGVARGISELIRYGYQQRRNQATHLAVPLGRFRVPKSNANSELSILGDIDVWIRSLHREAHPADNQKSKQVPARLIAAYGGLQNSLFSVIREQTIAKQWQDVLLRLSEVEAVMRRGSGFAADPVPPLRPEWAAASYDGTAEYRLALAFALQTSGYSQGAIRRHWLPLDRQQRRFAKSGTEASAKLDVSSEVVMHGRSGLDDAIALVTRRLLEAAQRSNRHLPLRAAPRAAASVADLTGLLSGGVDLDRTLSLGRALMALDHRAWAEQYIPMESPHTDDWPDDAWLAIRLVALPWPLGMQSGFKFDIGAEPAIIRRLAAGDAASALTIALRRLAAVGVRCTVRTCTASPQTAKLWAAALAFPINQSTARRFLQRLDPSKRSNHDH